MLGPTGLTKAQKIEAHERLVPIEEMEQGLADGRKRFVSSYQPAGYREPLELYPGQKLEDVLHAQAEDLRRLRQCTRDKQDGDGDEREDKLVDV